MNISGALRERFREHAVVSAGFFASRAVLHFMGIRFNFDIGWMFLSDPEELRHRLLETAFYFHAYPPGTNLLTGAVLKLGGAHPEALAHGIFQVLGFVLVNSLFYLCRASGLSLVAAAAISLAFSLSPPSIYFEHLYHYAYPIAALLCLSAALFHRGVERRTSGAWLGFFATCAAIGFIRNTFHLVWFVAMIALALAFSGKSARRTVIVAALGPGALLLALYLKNLAIFGVFGATTFGAANLTTVTVARLPEETRNEWIAEGKLSPFASISVYDGPRKYLPYFQSSPDPRWPSSMTSLDRPTLKAPNFNHWFFLDVNRARRADATYYLRAQPLAYAATARDNLVRFFGPSTEWHPHDADEASPHHAHRQVLGPYENIYNRALHSWPVPSVGLYAFLPFVCLWALLRARSLVRAEDRGSNANGALLCYGLIQIGFVVAASSLFAFGEMARYRYDAEAMIWLLGALSTAALWNSKWARAMGARRNFLGER
jgi:hypothetical protein